VSAPEIGKDTLLRSPLRRLNGSSFPLLVFGLSRGLAWVLALATLAFAGAPRIPNLSGLGHGSGWNPPWLSDLGSAVEVWGRYDAAWFVRIGEHGYAAAQAAPAFYPLYPTGIAVLGRLTGGHFLAAAVAIAIVFGAVAFALLYRLAVDKVGQAAARRTVVLLAVFPTALFFQAAYSESLFLALAVATFLAAERGHLPTAALLAGLALLTRPTGAALLPALVVFAWQSRSRLRSLASLLLAPLVFMAYPLLLWIQVGDPLAFRTAEMDPIWARSTSLLGPIGGIVDGLRAGVAGLMWNAGVGDAGAFWPLGSDKSFSSWVNIFNLFVLVIFLPLAVIAWRRLGFAYGAYALSAILLPLAAPSARWPLLSLPRFVLVDFPCFIALALVLDRPRRFIPVVAVSCALLAWMTIRWTTWNWVA
jgi:hypothetical protein